MRIEILSNAEDDLVPGVKFYERRRAGLGEYFLNSLLRYSPGQCRYPEIPL
jgi:hypothetical protein